MPATTEIFDNVHKSDPLGFWSNDQLDYKEVSRFLDLGKNELSKIGGIRKNSVRLAPDRIPKELKERLDQIANICSLVAEFFDGDAEKTALWFKTPNPLLGNVSPRDMIRLGRYAKLIKFVTEARKHNGKKQK